MQSSPVGQHNATSFTLAVKFEMCESFHYYVVSVSRRGELSRQRFKHMRQQFFLISLLAVTAIAVPAQTFTTLASFDGNGGAQPTSSPVQGLDGNLYGTTQTGGSGAQGTVFRLTPDGILTSIFSFCAAHFCLNGSTPIAGLVLAPSGTFYGTAEIDNVFKINTEGNQSVLYNFCSQPNCTDGANPKAALIQGPAGNVFGTTANGGANGKGTVFRMAPSGTVTTIYSFCAQTNCIDGSAPEGALVLGTDGNFYGTTSEGGANGRGTIFKVNPQGTFTTLYNFCSRTHCADGSGPIPGLVQGADGNFYGMTLNGGTGQACATKTCGTFFKMTSTGRLTTLYDFCSQTGCTDGLSPINVIQATDGNFYGTTFLGGANGAGTFFRITTSGALITLYNFCSEASCADGASGHGLVQHTDGKLYGVTEDGGISNNGTVFSVDIGLPPFVAALPYVARTGSAIRILGQGLTGTTAVSFNGAAATFSIQSDTYLTATVPVGATSGFVTVTASGNTLTSNHPFQLIP